MTVRGDGVPLSPMAAMPALEWVHRLGASPPMRMRASWFGSLRPTGYKVAARVPRAPTASSPRMRHPDHNQRAAVLGAVKARPGNTERAARPERRPTLTAPARAGLHDVWVGRRNGIPSRTKKLE